MNETCRLTLVELWFGAVLLLAAFLAAGCSDALPDPGLWLQAYVDSEVLRRLGRIVIYMLCFVLWWLPVWRYFVAPRLAVLRRELGEAKRARAMRMLFISALLYAAPAALMLSLLTRGLAAGWLVAFALLAFAWLGWGWRRGPAVVARLARQARLGTL